MTKEEYETALKTAVIQHLSNTQHVKQKGNETEGETSFGSIQLTAKTYLPTLERNSYASLTNTCHAQISYTRYSTETQSKSATAAWTTWRK